MFTLTSLSSPFRSSTIFSRIGETAWHGPHHSAKMSTSTGVSLVCNSWSKVDYVAAMDTVLLTHFGRSESDVPGGEPLDTYRSSPCYDRPIADCTLLV